MAFHYAPPEEYLTYSSGPKEALEFPRRCAELCLKHKQVGMNVRAHTHTSKFSTSMR